MARKRARGTGAEVKTPKAGAAPPSVLPVDMSAAAVALRNAATKNLSKIGAIPQDSLIDRVYGIPLVGNLPMQYLLGVDVVPMERTLSLVGEKGSLKSVMSWYFGALFLRYYFKGMVFFIDAELKTNDDQIRGVLQNDNLLEFLFATEVHNLDELCETMAFFSKQYDVLMPAHDVPICYIVDSIGAVTSKAAQAALEKTGNVADTPGYDNARRAAQLTEHFRAWVPQCLSGRPMVLVYINHIKEKIGAEGGGGRASYMPPEKVSPGGVHKDYLNTATIEMIKKSAGTAVKSEMRALVKMQTIKASLTETGRYVEVLMRTLGPKNMRYPEGDILGSLETDTDVQRYYVYFDWDTSLVEILTRENRTFPDKSLNDVIKIAGSGNSLSCKRLGVKDVSKQELGQAIHASPEVVKELQDVIGVLRKRHFKPENAAKGPPVPGESSEDKEKAKG